MQAMWSDTLDSDLVKWFVGLGTELIKIVDAIGLIPSILAAILAYKLAVGAIKMFDLGSIGTYISLLFTANNVTEVQGLLVTKNALAQKLCNSTLIQAQAARMGLTAADLAGYSVTQLLTLGVKGLAAGFKNLWLAMGPVGWAIIGVTVALTAGIAIFNAVHKTAEELAEELSDLKSELQDIESEIDTLNSELETTQERMAELIAMPSLSFVEQEELENLKAQTAELERQLELRGMLAKSKQAEVVKATEEYIDRAWDSESLDKTYLLNGAGVIEKDKGWNGFWNKGVNTKTALAKAINTYNVLRKAQENYDNIVTQWDDDGSNEELLIENGIDEWTVRHNDFSKKYFETLAKENQKRLQPIADGINMVFADESFDDLKYGMSDDIDAFLDELYAFQYKWQEAQGISAKSSAIASIFDDTSSDSIKKLKEDLSEIAGDDTLDSAKKQKNALALVNKAINSTSGEYDRLKTSMEIVGITADEVARYFTQMSSMPDSSTVEGLTAQYQKGVEALGKYHGAAQNIIAEFTNLDGSVEQITWGSLFDENGETIDTQISKVLQGANETTRAEFARIAKSVNEGTMSIEAAMSSFSGSGLVSVSKLIEESFGELNKSVFKGLEDEISGFIDTFSEFSAALEDVASSMDLLHTAQEQYNNSGQVSVKTALELMQSTDQWNKILTVENGKITLNTEAQDILVQSKLNTVEANLAEAKASIQNQLAQLGAADATLLSAEASDITSEAYVIYTNAMNSYTASIAAFGAAIDALINGRIVGEDGVLASFKSAYDSTKEIKTYENNTNISALREKLAEVEAMEDFFEGVDTVDEFKDNYDFDETPGDKYADKKDKTEEALDAFQAEMDYWENRIGAEQSKYEQVQNEIDLLEKQGKRAGEGFYQAQIDIEEQRRDLLEQQKTAAEGMLKSFAEGSDEWWEVANTLNDIEAELDDVTASLQELNDAIAQIHWDNLEEFGERASGLHEELSDIRDILSSDDMFNDEGEWTEAGVATLGSYIQEIELYKNELEQIQNEINDFNKGYQGREEHFKATWGIDSEQEYYDKLTELNELQREYTLGIHESEQSVVEMYENQVDAIEEYTEELIDSYNDYIDVVREALDAERDLYEFKKSTTEKTKNIAELERRIASLSGSTNAADVAERRKLQAELTDAKSDLDDHYYDHAKDAQSQALDKESEAYEETMNNYIERLRTTLDEAQVNMDRFMEHVTTTVMFNAGVIEEQYNKTGLAITEDLISPWTQAKAVMEKYQVDGMAMMNSWTVSGGFFDTFNRQATEDLKSPWEAGSLALGAFSHDVDAAMANMYQGIKSNVANSVAELQKLQAEIDKINSTTVRTPTSGDDDTPEPPPPGPPTEPPTETPTSVSATAYLKTSIGSYSAVRSATTLEAAKKAAKDAVIQIAYMEHKRQGYDELTLDKLNASWERNVTFTAPTKSATTETTTKGKVSTSNNRQNLMYAKGTLGTIRDQWAITDEPQFGDELVLVPGKNGNLSFMRKGTGVVPADLTQKLFELAQIPTRDLMNKNMTAIVPNITKNEFKNEFNFESLVHVDTVDSDTLPKLERMVDKKIDDFSRALNYSLKKFTR